MPSLTTLERDYILLVEDDENDAFLTQRALRTAGISVPVERCCDGQAVIDFFEKLIDLRKRGEIRLPKLVLLDFKIPQVTGLDVLAWIRRNQLVCSSVVLALTSSSSASDVTNAYQLNINSYLVKPNSLLEMTQLAKAIAHFWIDQPNLILPNTALSSRLHLR